tara:strand:+ start:243 stop:560 length:318 start_codon:yes stop_codon:yes gene_type:complete
MKLKQTNNTTYAEQRKSRLQDVVDDYLQDDDVSVLEMYNDIRDCLEDIISYHEMCKSRAQGALELIVGHHSTNKVDTDAPNVNTYEYAAHITMNDINRFQQGNSL